jgi:hypothetical protein
MLKMHLTNIQSSKNHVKTQEKSTKTTRTNPVSQPKQQNQPRKQKINLKQYRGGYTQPPSLPTPNSTGQKTQTKTNKKINNNATISTNNAQPAENNFNSTTQTKTKKQKPSPRHFPSSSCSLDSFKCHELKYRRDSCT